MSTHLADGHMVLVLKSAIDLERNYIADLEEVMDEYQPPNTDVGYKLEQAKERLTKLQALLPMYSEISPDSRSTHYEVVLKVHGAVCHTMGGML